MKLVISLATRGRPQQLMDTVNISLANWRDQNTVMMLQIDDDDHATINHLNAVAPHAWFVGPNGPRVLLNVKAREDTIAAKWNRALQEPADLYLVAADDDPYITEGYDAKLLEAARLFPDGVGMVYGHMANASFSGVVAPTRGLTEKLGHIFPEYFPYWFVDHWTDDLARMIGRIAFADVRTDQSKAGKTQEMREPGWWATFFDACYLFRRRIAGAVLDSPDLDTPDWMKQMLRESFPLIEARSKWINDQVRAQDKHLQGWSGLDNADPRYLRIKSQAVAMLSAMFDGMPEAEQAAFRKVLMPPTTIASIPQAFSKVA